MSQRTTIVNYKENTNRINIKKRDCDARQNRDNNYRSLFHVFLTIIAADKSIYDAEHINHDIKLISAQLSKYDLI